MGFQLAASSPAYVTAAVVVTGALLLIYLWILARRSRLTSQRLDRAEQLLVATGEKQAGAAATKSEVGN